MMHTELYSGSELLFHSSVPFKSFRNIYLYLHHYWTNCTPISEQASLTMLLFKPSSLNHVMTRPKCKLMGLNYLFKMIN